MHTSPPPPAPHTHTVPMPGQPLPKRVLCVHGGLGRLRSMQPVRQLRRPILPGSPEEEIMHAILWSDPAEGDHINGG